MRWSAPLALVVAAAGCTGHPADRTGSSPTAAADVGADDKPADEVHFPRLLAPDAGGPDVFLMAQLHGRLVRRGRCLGFAEPPDGRFATLVWPSEASLGRDARGLFVDAGGHRFREGDLITGGGGAGSGEHIDKVLDRPFPDECRTPTILSIWGVRPGDPSPKPPTPAPPPPPPAR